MISIAMRYYCQTREYLVSTYVLGFPKKIKVETIKFLYFDYLRTAILFSVDHFVHNDAFWY